MAYEFEQGFLIKCAEAGLTVEQADELYRAMQKSSQAGYGQIDPTLQAEWASQGYTQPEIDKIWQSRQGAAGGYHVPNSAVTAKPAEATAEYGKTYGEAPAAATAGSSISGTNRGSAGGKAYGG